VIKHTKQQIIIVYKFKSFVNKYKSTTSLSSMQKGTHFLVWHVKCVT
jgi:hypothetical protein